MSPGEKIADFEVRELLSRSAAGAVYRAVDDDGDSVILKELAFRGDEGELGERGDRLIDALEFLRELDHPGLAEVFDYFSTYRRAFVVMEDVRGRTLEQERRERNFAVSEIAAIAGRLCAALVSLQRGGSRYRFKALAPSHVLLDEEGLPRLVNYGLGRFFASGRLAPALTDDRASPPEDLEALGRIIVFLATGEVPSMETLPAGLPDPLKSIVRRFLPGATPFGSFAELHGALEACGEAAPPIETAAPSAEAEASPAEAEAPAPETRESSLPEEGAPPAPEKKKGGSRRKKAKARKRQERLAQKPVHVQEPVAVPPGPLPATAPPAWEAPTEAAPEPAPAPAPAPAPRPALAPAPEPAPAIAAKPRRWRLVGALAAILLVIAAVFPLAFPSRSFSGKALVLCEGGRVAIHSPRDGRIIDSFVVPGAPLDLLLSGEDRLLYFAVPSSKRLVALDPATRRTVRRISLKDSPGRLYGADEGSPLFAIGDANPILTVLSGDGLESREDFSVGVDPKSLAYDRARRLIYLAGRKANLLLTMDLMTSEILPGQVVEGEPVALALLPRRNELWCAMWKTSYVRVLETPSLKELRLLPLLGSYPADLVPSPDGACVYAALFGSHTAARIPVSGDRGEKKAYVPVGRKPCALALAPDGRLWVANLGSGTVSIIDRAFEGAREVRTGKVPRRIVFVP